MDQSKSEQLYALLEELDISAGKDDDLTDIGKESIHGAVKELLEYLG